MYLEFTIQRNLVKNRYIGGFKERDTAEQREHKDLSHISKKHLDYTQNIWTFVLWPESEEEYSGRLYIHPKTHSTSVK